jgi:hypothetical protein
VTTVRIDLTQEELDLLRELLDHANAELREEVYKTEASDWKRALKARKNLLAALVAKVEAGTRH